MGELLFEPLMLGDVAEAPDPPDDRAGEAPRLRIAFEDAAVREMEDVVAVRFGLRVQLVHLG